MSLADFQRKIGVKPDGQWGPETFRAGMRYLKLSPLRAAHFFGQCAHETQGFKRFVENLNYGAKGLRDTFPSYVRSEGEAQHYARKPEAIANHVYGGREGNGPEASGDGWRYRGRGALHLTFKNNYKAFAEAARRPDVVSNPDIVATELAFESAAHYFTANGLWSACDAGVDDATILAVTKRINKHAVGLAERTALTRECARWAGVGEARQSVAPLVVPPSNQGNPSSATAPRNEREAQGAASSDPGQLSAHFSLAELVHSETALRLHLDNTPNAIHRANLVALCTHVLEPVRAHFGKPVHVNSGYRGPALNTAVGGVEASQHCKGEAADIEIAGVSNVAIATWIAENLDFDQVILEHHDPKEGPNSGWVHVSYRGGNANRRSQLMAKKGEKAKPHTFAKSTGSGEAGGSGVGTGSSSAKGAAKSSAPLDRLATAKPAASSSKSPSGAVMLSEHFSLAEFTRSETAQRLRIDNTPSAEHLEHMKLVCKAILEPVYAHFGDKVLVTSGYRGPKLNAAVKGSAKSQHCKGEAVDFKVEGVSNADLARWVVANCAFDQLILEFHDPKKGPNSGWVHASTKASGNRRDRLRASSKGGKTVYEPWSG